jgi:hypothetical protein
LVCPATLGIVVVVYRSRADALPLLLLASSLADALLPRVSWPLSCTDALPSGRLGGCFAAFGSLVPLSGRCFAAEGVGLTSWWMLGRHGRLVFSGGCFAAIAAGCCCVFSGWMLCHHGFVFVVGNLSVGSLLQAQL